MTGCNHIDAEDLKISVAPKARDCILILNLNACNQNDLPTCSTRSWNPGL